MKFWITKISLNPNFILFGSFYPCKAMSIDIPDMFILFLFKVENASKRVLK